MFELRDYLSKFDSILLSRREGRIALTKNDPLLFALLYLPEHLQNEAGEISLSEFHLALLEYAKSWIEPVRSPAEFRDAFIAPRGAGKSTWIFTLLPLWAAAHGHVGFILAISDSATQAEEHLQTFKTECELNTKLRADFPDLCATMKGSNVARDIANNRGHTIRANGFVFSAKGIDSGLLGTKVGSMRPQVIILDDIEPVEANYSPYLASQRLGTVLNGVLPLNVYARVCFVGTTTMAGSIMDMVRKVGELQEAWEGEGDLRDSLEADMRWVVDEGLRIHYWPAVIDDEGVERSVWPEKWSMDYLNSIRHTRSFAMNMMNRPISLDAGYWDTDDIQIAHPDEYLRTIISVDPAVTTAKKSDYTGIAVMSRGNDGKVYLRHAEQVKLGSQALNEHISGLVERFDAKVVYVESNQGGDLWRQVFAGVPAKVKFIRQTEKKEVRAAKAHDLYKREKVFHTANFPAAEEQMLAFPKTTHDDIVDAITSGVLYFLGKPVAAVRATEYQYA